MTYTRPDRASEVVFEEFDDPTDPKPHGYIGTMGGVRFTHSTVEDYCPCGHGGGHYLSCGHTVVGAEACGSNCKAGTDFEQPFNCPRCQDMVKAVLKTEFTQEQKEKVNSLKRMKDPLAIPVAVEYITKYLPLAKGNLAPTVLSLLEPGYGRECLDVPSESSEQKTIAQLFAEHQSTLEQKTRARLAKDNLGPLNKHEKRKASGPTPDSPATDGEVVTPATIKKQKAKLMTRPEPITEANRGMKRALPENDDSFLEGETLVENDTPSPVDKRQRQKLQVHREPITEASRGEKRAIPEEDEKYLDGEALVENESPSPANKKLRQKLQVHAEPISPDIQGTKRKLDGREVFANTTRPSKRILSSYPQVFGDGHFMPIPPAGSSSIWEEQRKQDQNEYLRHDGGNKGPQNWEVIPGRVVVIPAVHFGT